MIGQMLSHYRIVEQIGEGGMGVVYRARDEHLDRDVALKVLPPELAQDPDWLERFLHEAKLLASVNHPNISTIHGFEESEENSHFLVLELLEGETLSERLKGDPLPVTEALRVCSEIAAALEAAHQRGIIHRDLKPGNVILTRSGTAKVLDFGLARRSPEASKALDATRRTAGPPLSEAHMLIGSPGYMSPEQVRGEPEDRRADIFAFGCVLFECLAGRRAFEGSTAIDVMAAVLDKEPVWGALPVDTPPAIRNLLVHCLEKNPQKRLRDIGDARIEIDDARSMSESQVRPVVPTAARTPHNLPQQLTSFVGREQEIAECMRLLGQTRLLTLTGIGGCGKSRLLMRVAEELFDQYPDGIWIVDLAPLSDPLRVAGTLLVALGLREEGGKTLIQTLAEHLREKHALILLDNCEHMLSAASELANTHLESCRHLKILTTSREAMGIAGELTYQVPSLSLPDPGRESNPEAVGRSEAARLFVERAAFVRPRFALNEQTVPAVAEICRRLDGIPLAIELAAARVKVLAVEEIRARLGDRFRLLTGGSKASLPRHQTLRAAIQWSYDQLSEEEQQLLQALSVFAGGCTLDAALAVCGEGRDEFKVLDLLTSLVNKSLVVVDRTGGAESRYRLLETVRQYALETLNVARRAAEIRGRHLDYFLGFAVRAEPNMIGAGEVEWLARLERDHENILAGLSWCRESEGGGEKALRLAGSIWRFWDVRGHLAVGRESLGWILDRARAAAPTKMLADALYGAANLAIDLGDLNAGRAQFEECLVVSRGLNYRDGVASAMNGLGIAARYAGDYEAACSCFEGCLEEARALGDKRAIAVALANLGDVAMAQQDYPSARRIAEESLARFRELGGASHIQIALLNLGTAFMRLGDPAGARARFVEALALEDALGSKSTSGETLEAIGELAQQLGEAEVATRLCGAADAVREATGYFPFPTHELSKTRQAAISILKSQLGEARYAALDAEGRALSLEATVQHAREWLERWGARAEMREA